MCFKQHAWIYYSNFLHPTLYILNYPSEYVDCEHTYTYTDGEGWGRKFWRGVSKWGNIILPASAQPTTIVYLLQKTGKYHLPPAAFGQTWENLLVPSGTLVLLPLQDSAIHHVCGGLKRQGGTATVVQ